MPPQPGLDTLTQRVWQELTRAPHDQHHEWRTLVLATQGLDGWPQARTVVLRAVEAASWRLSVYTDARSPKCAELRAHSAAQMVFWSPRLGWQLRVAAQATVLSEGEAVRTAWARMSTSRSATDYLSGQAPGTVSTWQRSQETAPGTGEQEHHLALLTFDIVSIDWLALHRNGHRRARLSRNGAVQPLTP